MKCTIELTPPHPYIRGEGLGIEAEASTDREWFACELVSGGTVWIPKHRVTSVTVAKGETFAVPSVPHLSDEAAERIVASMRETYGENWPRPEPSAEEDAPPQVVTDLVEGVAKLIEDERKEQEVSEDAALEGGLVLDAHLPTSDAVEGVRTKGKSK